MKIISHRGNLNGIERNLENNPDRILEVIKKFEVEVDVWYVNNKWFLGHDLPTYEVTNFFFSNKMWLHAKNFDACIRLKNTELNWFWHENDKITLTSKNYLWCFPGVYIQDGITVEFGHNKNLPKNILGVCTDFPELY